MSTASPSARRREVVAADAPATYPALDLPVRPPLAPMEARSVDVIPEGPGWQYEPKWDGFRCLAFRDGDTVALQSKNGQPLTRYFPEVVAYLLALPRRRFVLDGELVIFLDRHLAFDALLQRIHPAPSRIARLSHDTPGTLLAFDLLVDARGTSLLSKPLSERRARLERFFASLQADGIELSPVTTDLAKAREWVETLGLIGCDGIVAKLTDAPYRPGERDAMQKFKRQRTADCVVGGFRWASGGTTAIGSLLLGLYNDEGRLDHVGFTAGFSRQDREALKARVLPLRGGAGFTGRAPGGPSRWSRGRSAEWEPLEPRLVCEVQYDHASGGRFRHGTRFVRWRPDKAPRQCTFAQLVRSSP